tara:strand:+ start:333 stop:938 length:606 start_codon:yes stop_codon:yes gene_type:complete
MKITVHQNDLPSDLNFGLSVAIDTETMGLNPIRDKLCLIQISKGNNVCHLIKINNNNKPKNLIKILKNNKIQKIFHYARFDVAILKFTYGVNIKNIFCTKIASKLVRTYTDKHGYKDLCSELLNISISKSEQTSDWGGALTLKQKNYAATDVLYLHKLKNKLNKMLQREKRVDIANECFKFIEHRTELDLNGWADQDIFRH